MLINADNFLIWFITIILETFAAVTPYFKL